MRCLAMSDTHGRHSKIFFYENKIDTIIHSGDFTSWGSHKKEPFIEFINWYADLPIKNKILIAGNHDYFIERNNHSARLMMKELGIIYLEDSSIVIDGIKFYGSPWTPVYLNLAFMKEDFDLQEIYEKIDLDTNVLISHGPPKGILDKSKNLMRVGSSSLRRKLKDLKKLKFVVFGHVHESRGRQTIMDVSYINASLRGLENHFVFEVFPEVN